MIQPVPSRRSEWFLFILELNEPIHAATGEILLPTFITILDSQGSPLSQPEMMPELDQARTERLLEQLFDEHSTPEYLVISSHEDWDEQSWLAFSKEFNVEIRFRDFSSADLAAKIKIHHTFPAAALNPAALANGLLQTAQRLRSQRRREAFLRKCLELSPDFPAARIELADIEFARGDFKKCLQTYRELAATEKSRWKRLSPLWWEDLQTRPYLRALYGEAMTLWHQGKYEKASSLFETLLHTNPKDHQGVRFYLPMLYLLSDRFEEAAEFYQHYQRHYPGDFIDPAFYLGWGLVCATFGDEELAKQKYHTAILRNIYIAPILLDLPLPPSNFWMPNERAEPHYAHEFARSFATLWDREAASLRLIREAWEEAQPAVAAIIACREKITDFQDQRYDPLYKKHWEALLEEEARLTGSTNQL